MLKALSGKKKKSIKWILGVETDLLNFSREIPVTTMKIQNCLKWSSSVSKIKLTGIPLLTVLYGIFQNKFAGKNSIWPIQVTDEAALRGWGETAKVRKKAAKLNKDAKMKICWQCKIHCSTSIHLFIIPSILVTREILAHLSSLQGQES